MDLFIPCIFWQRLILLDKHLQWRLHAHAHLVGFTQEGMWWSCLIQTILNQTILYRWTVFQYSFTNISLVLIWWHVHYNTGLSKIIITVTRWRGQHSNWNAISKSPSGNLCVSIIWCPVVSYCSPNCSNTGAVVSN